MRRPTAVLRVEKVTWVAVAGFFVAIIPLVLTPGARFTLATQRTLTGQRGGTALVVAGTATGIYVHALLAAAGLSALVMRSSEAFTVIKIVGAVYLICLGLLTIWRTRQHRDAPEPARLPWAGQHAYPQAVLANVLNPKAASIYLTLGPQFLNAQQVGVASMLVLASVHVLAMGSWLGLWSVALKRTQHLPRSKWFARAVNRVGGAILVALGVRSIAS